MTRGRLRSALAASLAAVALCLAGTADDPAERLPNPAQEARARNLFRQLRCVVCQNESIDDSQADIAGDLRKIVRAQIAAGKTDAEVRDYLVQRYGEFILLKPTLSPGNLALWLSPFVLIALGGGYLWINSRRPAVEDASLTEEEQRALEAIGSEDGDVTLAPQDGLTNSQGAVAIKP